MASGLARSRSASFKTVALNIAAGASILTVGFIGWLLRGGTLAAALLSSLPLWRGFDPLMVVLQPRRPENLRGGSKVEALFDKARGDRKASASLV